MIIHEGTKTAEIDVSPAGQRLIGIKVFPNEDLDRILNGMKDRTLPGTIPAEQERNRSQVQLNSVANPFEVFYGNLRDHDASVDLSCIFEELIQTRGDQNSTLAQELFVSFNTYFF